MINPNSQHSRYKIALHKNVKYADLAFFGGVTLEIANDAFIELLEHRLFRHNMHACYDFTQAIIETDMKELEQHAEFVSHYTHQRGTTYKLAMVTDETLNSALLNVYRLLISKTTIEAEVFSRKKQALLWLNQDAF